MAPFFSDAERADCWLSTEHFCGGLSGRGEAVLLRPRPRNWEGYECPAFDSDTNRCTIYSRRPLDCRLYPFLLTFDERGEQVLLTADFLCPFVREASNLDRVMSVGRRTAELLEVALFDAVLASSGMVSEYEPTRLVIGELPRLGRALCRSDLGLSRLTLSCRKRLDGFFEKASAGLSYYSFASIFMWSDFFDLRWRVVNDRLLIVAQGDGAAFLLAPPLGSGDLRPAVEAAWAILDALCPNSPAARIENVPDADLASVLQVGGRVQHTAEEYVGERERWASLAGNSLKGQRAACNRFVRTTQAAWRPFRNDDLPAVVSLYRAWARERSSRYRNTYYCTLLANSFLAHVRALRAIDELSLTARVVEVDGRLAAYTFGTPVADGSTFAVLGEVADLSVRDLAAFTFRQLCREVAQCRWVNIMDDCGLQNLRNAKLGYHPELRLNAHSVVRALQ